MMMMMMMSVHCGKTAGRIKMLFWMVARVGQKNYALYGGQDTPSYKGKKFRGKLGGIV